MPVRSASCMTCPLIRYPVAFEVLDREEGLSVTGATRPAWRLAMMIEVHRDPLRSEVCTQPRIQPYEWQP